MNDKYTVLASLIEVKRNLTTRTGKADLYKVLPHRKNMPPATIWVNEPKSHPWTGSPVGTTVACAVLGADELLNETQLAALPMSAYDARNGGSQ